MGLGSVGSDVGDRHRPHSWAVEECARGGDARGAGLVGLLHLQLGVAAADPENLMNDGHAPLAALEAQLLRDPFNAGARLEYARALLEAARPADALTQYDLARKQGAPPALEEFEALRTPPPPPPAREPVKLSVVPGTRSADVVSIAR